MALFAAPLMACALVAPAVVFADESSTRAGQEAPIEFAALEKVGFAKPFFRNLTEKERATFDQIYPPDREMLERVTIGDGVRLEECIAGEPPPVDEAFRKFPVHYPMLGRMKRVPGTLEWIDGKLIFRTDRQRYYVDEFHTRYRLEQMGFTVKSKPRQATLDAVWTVNRIDALRLLYVEKIELR